MMMPVASVATQESGRVWSKIVITSAPQSERNPLDNSELTFRFRPKERLPSNNRPPAGLVVSGDGIAEAPAAEGVCSPR
jgi:hypothetical protein